MEEPPQMFLLRSPILYWGRVPDKVKKKRGEKERGNSYPGKVNFPKTTGFPRKWAPVVKKRNTHDFCFRHIFILLIISHNIYNIHTQRPSPVASSDILVNSVICSLKSPP